MSARCIARWLELGESGTIKAKVTGLSSIRLALLVALGAGGCSLLAPSREELSGGKARDSSVPDTGAAGGDEGGSSEVEGGIDVMATADAAPDVSDDAGDTGADGPNTLDCTSRCARQVGGDHAARSDPDLPSQPIPMRRQRHAVVRSGSAQRLEPSTWGPSPKDCGSRRTAAPPGSSSTPEPTAPR